MYHLVESRIQVSEERELCKALIFIVNQKPPVFKLLPRVRVCIEFCRMEALINSQSLTDAYQINVILYLDIICYLSFA